MRIKPLRNYVRGIAVGGSGATFIKKKPVTEENTGISPLIVGNWKMYKTVRETTFYFHTFLKMVEGVSDIQIGIAPTALSLNNAVRQLNSAERRQQILLGVQNIPWEKEGVFTGEISAEQAREAGADFAIIGHSKRRQYFAETDEIVNKKVSAALQAGLMAIMCVGETLEEREAGITKRIVEHQLRQGLAGLPSEMMKNTVIAYEPVWAIGTGKTVTPEQADEVHRFIRNLVWEIHGPQLALSLRILYGGSVNPDNSNGLMAMPNIDGVLVGDASLDPQKFAKIVKFGL